MEQDNLFFYDYHPRPADFLREVTEGLAAEQKRISAKFFYDQRGSQIFDDITRLPEYYLTRKETEILERYAMQMADCLESESVLVEPGSGSAHKVRMLLEHVRPAAYVPVEISREYLQQSAARLAADYDWLDVHAACADFTRPMELPKPIRSHRAAAFFPGSTIGNFEPDQALDLLQNFSSMVGTGGQVLIGVDLKKDQQTLQAAYDDNEGITAQFNLNLLTRMNRELAADFDLDAFYHRAVYNTDHGRMESFLVSRREQTISIGEQEFLFTEGEAINTEYSYKYHIDEFQELAAAAGLSARSVWTDNENMFSVHLLEND